MRRVFLRYLPADAPSCGWALIRDLCGQDEDAVSDTGTAAAIGLLDRLLVDTDGVALRPGEAEALTASDRDRLLADVYSSEFGDRIDCVLRCVACDSPFDIDFRLSGLMSSLDLPPAGKAGPAASVVTLEDGRRCRLPRGGDELAVQDTPGASAASALLARCMIEGEAGPDDRSVLAALESAAPILDVELDATCPECGTAMQAHFDLQHFLLSAIMQDTPARIAEIHLLASTYGWSLREILDLDRKRRRAFATAIERDRGAHVGSA
jgi:hypothetical protein